MYNDIKYWAQLLKESEQEKKEYKEACEAFEAEDKKIDEAMPTTANLNQAISLLDAIIAGNCEDEEDIYLNVENAYKLLTGTEHPASSTFSPQH